jgi:hypothetical protein
MNEHDLSAFGPARYCANIHTGGAVLHTAPFPMPTDARDHAQERITKLEEQGAVITQAYVFDMWTGHSVFDILGDRPRLSLGQRLLRLFKRITGV